MIGTKETAYYELLVLRCQCKEKEALDELIQYFEKRLFYYIRRLVKNEEEAWNILQEVWLNVLDSINTLRNPKSLPSWLYSITRKIVMHHLRSKYGKQILSDYLQDVAGLEAQNQELSFDNAEMVHYGLEKISLSHREVLTLYFLKDLSIKQICEVLDISIGTVKSRLHYAKHALKTVLEKEKKNG